MAGMIPMAMYGLEVPCGDVAITARPEIPSAFRITMAAIDPTAEPEGDEGAPPRATLKVIRQPLSLEDYDESDEDDDEFDADEFERRLAEGGDSDEDESEDDEEVNGGPSDPSKSKKARTAAAEKALRKMLAGDGEGMEVDLDDEPNGVNGVSKSAKSKGKMPASDEDEDDEDEDDDDDSEGDEVEEFVICTLDPQKNYQQPLDITIGEDERVWFKVTGTHSIFLTGNYVETASAGRPGMYDPDEDEEGYDYDPDSDELDEEDDEEDELDDMEDPRITEIDEDEEEAPKLVETANQKKKAVPAKVNQKKRPAEDEEAQTLDEMITKESTTNGELKLSKKQLKKMKKNDGTAAAVEDKAAEAPSSAKSDKKVSFAKQLEQGPTPGAAPTKDSPAEKEKPKATIGVKIVQGVTIDDKKLGTGPAAKSGDRVGMRYIGKLQSNNKIFDSNKKGKPFSFKLGSGQVIRGWDIGIQGMTVGGERRITIPANLAYGSKAQGDIPANSTLVFDVKMLEINKGK